MIATEEKMNIGATTEIEITSEMIERGGQLLRSYLPEVSYGEGELLAKRTFRAMWDAKLPVVSWRPIRPHTSDE